MLAGASASGMAPPSATTRAPCAGRSSAACRRFSTKLSRSEQATAFNAKIHCSYCMRWLTCWRTLLRAMLHQAKSYAFVVGWPTALDERAEDEAARTLHANSARRAAALATLATTSYSALCPTRGCHLRRTPEQDRSPHLQQQPRLRFITATQLFGTRLAQSPLPSYLCTAAMQASSSVI